MSLQRTKKTLGGNKENLGNIPETRQSIEHPNDMDKIDWMGIVNRSGCRRVAEAFGIEVNGRGDLDCPRCHKPAQAKKARILSQDRFYCLSCQTKASPVDFAALLVLGEVPTQRRQWGPVKEALQAHGVLGHGELPAPPRMRPVSPTPLRPSFPPSDSLAALWNAAKPVTADPQAASYLKGRGIDPAQLAAKDTCRVIQSGIAVPSWAVTPFRQAWSVSGHRLLTPLFDASGTLVTVRARAFGTNKWRSLAPPSFSVVGTFFANEAFRHGNRRTVVVVEGDSDFWTWQALDPSVPCIGVFAGSVKPALGSLLPDGASVYIRTDLDPAGNKYAEEVSKALAGRCRIVRKRQGPDENDLLKAGLLDVAGVLADLPVPAALSQSTG